MMKTLKIITLALSCTGALLFISFAIVDGIARMRSAATMAESANKFLASLSPDQKAKAVFGFDDEQRFDWHFIPRDRKGVSLKELSD
ncbi:MAG: DUF3500 domain-containing protein, partial [Acidobacteria bacterium]|nr:DUF3500 domain-containing protein [Acidobacteriota bacterium]